MFVSILWWLGRLPKRVPDEWSSNRRLSARHGESGRSAVRLLLTILLVAHCGRVAGSSCPDSGGSTISGLPPECKACPEACCLNDPAGDAGAFCTNHLVCNHQAIGVEAQPLGVHQCHPFANGAVRLYCVARDDLSQPGWPGRSIPPSDYNSNCFDATYRCMSVDEGGVGKISGLNYLDQGP